MAFNFKDEVRVFMIFDILGDTLRSGPIEWAIKRERLESIKDHVFDLILMYRLLERYLPSDLNGSLVIDYLLVHDLAEAITGDITKFGSVSDDERTRVSNIATDYLIRKFNTVIDFCSLMIGFENKSTMEAKIASLLDSIHSATTFIKYAAEGITNIDDSDIIPELKMYQDIARERNIDLGDVFYEYHRKKLNFTDEECCRFKITREEADYITSVMTSFIDEFHDQKNASTLLSVSDDFPKDATQYKRKK